MASLVSALVVLGGLGGCTLCWLGYRVHRLSPRLGRGAFTLFAGTLGVGCLATALVGLVPAAGVGIGGAIWPQLPVWFWLFATYPWFLFTLQYTGTRIDVGGRTAGLLALPYAFVALQLALSPVDSGNAVLSSLGSVTFIYTVALVAGGSYLLCQSASAAGHVSLGQGVSIAAAPVLPLVVWNTMTPPAEMAPGGRAAVFAAGTGVTTLAVAVALARYDLFGTTPAIGTLGKRGLVEETDDLMLVVDDRDRVVERNGTAADVLGTDRSEAAGSPLTELLGHSTETLRRTETVSVETTAGTRQYDPQVSAVSDPHGNGLGARLSLRDVTDRELREQRLAVLNRVLRHNLRNEADVVKANAEVLDDEPRADAIIDAVDSIAALGRRTRRIDRFISESHDDARLDVGRAVERAVDDAGAADAAVSVSVDTPSSATVVSNERALTSAVESAVDNALTHADDAVAVTVTERPAGYTVRVTDDGPGIPDGELDALAAGTEPSLEHGTGLGLWQLKWAVMTLNGELSFETDGGTTVEITVPDGSESHDR
ncbi:PAS domain-containing protein [Halolamina sp. CBA1230]|uniref:ATP-binding protein n=1 Tax=Halolamina sp. CBA1230 TaxID=1853690 RepID=UPI0009A21E6F|nr:ATP-binding protein [Halolamina sp. CBA1230]QKY20896.1 PAS domain-containing protein [Halolamina sp. CBA1230]